MRIPLRWKNIKSPLTYGAVFSNQKNELSQESKSEEETIYKLLSYHYQIASHEHKKALNQLLPEELAKYFGSSVSTFVDYSLGFFLRPLSNYLYYGSLGNHLSNGIMQLQKISPGCLEAVKECVDETINPPKNSSVNF